LNDWHLLATNISKNVYDFQKMAIFDFLLQGNTLVSFLIQEGKAVPIDPATSRALADIGSRIVQHDMSLLGLFWQAGLLVKSVMIFLILCSIWSWAIIIEKWVMIRSIKSQTASFEKLFWSGQSLEDLYDRIKGRETHPIAAIFAAAMHEWTARNKQSIAQNSSLRVGIKERVGQAMQVATNKSMDVIESNLSFLATVGSSAPFIGLFGTVWGIMTSFQAIAMSKNTSFSTLQLPESLS
jgi:biopolymer transport protein TolQ